MKSQQNRIELVTRPASARPGAAAPSGVKKEASAASARPGAAGPTRKPLSSAPAAASRTTSTRPAASKPATGEFNLYYTVF